MWQVIDSRDNRIIGRYALRSRAINRADRLDMEYGAVRYFVRSAPHPENPPAALREWLTVQS